MAKPLFKAGDHVHIRGGGYQSGGAFEVIRALPDEGRGPVYRVHSVAGGQEMVVPEHVLVRIAPRDHR